MNTFAVQALAAAAGPEFLRDVRAGGTPATVTDERRVLVRPERMHPIVDRYVQYWIDRLGLERASVCSQRARTTTGSGRGTWAAKPSCGARRVSRPRSTLSAEPARNQAMCSSDIVCVVAISSVGAVGVVERRP